MKGELVLKVTASLFRVTRGGGRGKKGGGDLAERREKGNFAAECN
jgi:hypothetical protein